MATPIRSARVAIFHVPHARTKEMLATGTLAYSAQLVMTYAWVKSVLTLVRLALTNLVQGAFLAIQHASLVRVNQTSARLAARQVLSTFCTRTSAWRTLVHLGWAVWPVFASTAISPALSAPQDPRSAQLAHRATASLICMDQHALQSAQLASR